MNLINIFILGGWFGMKMGNAFEDKMEVWKLIGIRNGGDINAINFKCLNFVKDNKERCLSMICFYVLLF